MKKLWFFLLFLLAFNIGVNAQDKDKLKKTSTIPQKAHNALSKHKKHKGYKVKHKRSGVTKKHKVDYKTGDVKNKRDK